MAGYKYSHLARFAEEAIAECYGTGSVWRGIRYPVVEGYVNGWNLAGESALYVGGTVGVGYGAVQLAY